MIEICKPEHRYFCPPGMLRSEWYRIRHSPVRYLLWRIWNSL